MQKNANSGLKDPSTGHAAGPQGRRNTAEHRTQMMGLDIADAEHRTQTEKKNTG